MKTTNFDDLLAENLKDKDFKKEYEALEEEFDVAKKIIHLRLTAGMTQTELARRHILPKLRFPGWNQEIIETSVWPFCGVSELFWE